jgi:hypothetical protein
LNLLAKYINKFAEKRFQNDIAEPESSFTNIPTAHIQINLIKKYDEVK